MKVVLRADAGVGTGTGHVMRCLTVAEELTARGHDVTLWGAVDGVEWLSDLVAAKGVRYRSCDPAELDVEAIAGAADVVVVDSYTIDAERIGALDEVAPVVAIIDGDSRGIRASAYLDQNLGAEAQPYPADVADRLWAGSRYALVRRELRVLRRAEAAALPPVASVLCVMGGSDPVGAMPRVAASLLRRIEPMRLVFVTAPEWHDAVRALVASHPDAVVTLPTPRLDQLLSQADVVVSATGTTAWDICTIGLPAVFVAVVDNQEAGLRSIVDAGVALGVDASEDPGLIDTVGDVVARLISDDELRAAHARRCRALFDGRGAERVVDAIERLAAGEPSRTLR